MLGAQMSEWLGVVGPSYVATSFKRELLLFDRIVYPNLSHMIADYHSGRLPRIDEGFIRELLALEAQGLIFEGDFGDELPAESKEWLSLFEQSRQRLRADLMDFTAPEPGEPPFVRDMKDEANRLRERRGELEQRRRALKERIAQNSQRIRALDSNRHIQEAVTRDHEESELELKQLERDWDQLDRELDHNLRLLDERKRSIVEAFRDLTRRHLINRRTSGSAPSAVFG
jgi:hypothetical protein